MAEKIELFELDVDYEDILNQQAELIKLINRLKEDQKALVKDTKNLTTATDEQAAAFVENQNSIKSLTADYNANNKVLTALNNTQVQNINTVEQARKALGDVSTLWARTTQIEGENSKSSKDLAARKLELTNRLKELEGATGDNTRNVGNYTESMKEALNATNAFKGGTGNVINNFIQISQQEGGIKSFFGSFVNGIKGATSAGLKFIATPIGAVIAAIALVVTVVVKAFKNFDPVIDKIQQGMAALSSVFSFVKNTITGLITGVKSLGDVFSSLGSDMSEAAKEGVALTKMQQELDDMNWKLTASSSKYKTKIDELILQSKDRTKSEEERMALIEEALKLEEAAFNEKKAVADQELEIAYRQIETGRNLTKAQKEELRKRGVDAAIALKETKDVSDEEVQELADKLAKMESVRQESISIREKAQNRANALAEKKQQDEEKARAKAEADKEKAREDYQKRLEKQRAELLKNAQLEKALFEAQNQSYLDGVDELNRELVDKELARLTEISTLDEAIDRQRLKNKEITQKEFDINQITRQNELNKTKLELNTQLYDQEQAQLYAEWEAQLAAEAEQNERLKALDEEFKAQEAERKLIDIENERALAEMNLYTAYEFKKRELDEKYKLEIEAAEKVGADTALINQKYEKTKTELARKEAAARLDVVNSFVGNIATLFGEGTKLGKLAAATQISIDAIKGAFSAFSAAQTLPPPFGQIVGAASAAAVLAMGVKKVKDIYAVKSGLPESGGGSVSAPSGGGYGGNSPIPQQVYDGGLTGSTSSGNTGQTIKTAMSEALAENTVQPVLVIDDVTAAQNVKSNIVSISSM